MRIATIFRTSAVIVALTKVGNEVDDDHEHLPVCADLDPLSHLMNLVKKLMTFRNNILFEPLNQEEATVYNRCSCLRRNIHLWSTLPSMGRKSSSTA